MTSLRHVLSIVVAAVVVLQPAAACCPDPATAGEAATDQSTSHTESVQREHCGGPPPAVADDAGMHHCKCADGCASMEARSPHTPDAAALPVSGQLQPAALVAQPRPMPPAPRAVSAQGLPPPAAAPPARPTLVSLKRLLLI